MDRNAETISTGTPILIDDVEGGNYPRQTDPIEFPSYRKVDIAIIGAGYAGTSAARKLATMGFHNTIVLEADHVGSGASGKSMGHVVGLQAPRDKIIAHCGRKIGERLFAAGERGRQLVRSNIAAHTIDCDVRPGYLWVDRQGGQRLEMDSNLFGIDPYPYVLGLASAAREKGVKIFEQTRVKDIQCESDHCRVDTDLGIVNASYVVAAGGHQMSKNIPALRHLQDRTVELYVTTLRTEPLPDEVIRAIMPVADGKRYPFSNEEHDVSDGSIDRYGRLSFNARVVAAPHRSDIDRIRAELNKMFPELGSSFRSIMGYDLVVEPMIQAAPINFTQSYLPHVGVTGSNGRILFADAFGGHGIAAATMVGEELARKLHGLLTNNPKLGAVFDDLASIRHMGFPVMRIKSFRRAMGELGVLRLRAPEYRANIRRRVLSSLKLQH